MNIKLIRATIEDSKELWQMQLESFQSLLDKYQDYDTNPASELIDKIIYRLKQEETYYYYPARVWIGESGIIYATHDYEDDVLVFDSIVELIKYELQNYDFSSVAKK